MVWRKVEPTTPPQVTYGLTEFGRDVGEPLTDLFDRVTCRLPARSAERRHRQHRHPVQVADFASAVDRSVITGEHAAPMAKAI